MTKITTYIDGDDGYTRSRVIDSGTLLIRKNDYIIISDIDTSSIFSPTIEIDIKTSFTTDINEQMSYTSNNHGYCSIKLMIPEKSSSVIHFKKYIQGLEIEEQYKLILVFDSYYGNTRRMTYTIYKDE